MTIQQKDALTNKIMVYITIAFGGTILWYVVFSLLKSSLKNMGYVVLLACAVLCVILGCFLWSKRHSLKTQNMKSYVRTSFISALFCLFMCCPFIFSLSNIQSKLPSIPYLTDTMTSAVKCSYVTMIGGYVALGLAILVNLVMMCKKTISKPEKALKNNQ